VNQSNAAGLDFSLLACRVSFSATREIRFPARAANTFRGALGYVLPNELFRPRHQSGPSGMVDQPRPFVLQAKELDSIVLSGGSFGIDLNLFDPALEPAFRDAFARLAAAGITAARVPLTLESWRSVRLSFSLAPEPGEFVWLRVRFLTPTELKGWDGQGLPPFATLACRLRDRISGLRALYGAGPLPIDFQEFGIRAAAVSALGGEITHDTATRTSRRTGLTHPLGGFTGYVDYSGPLNEFIPYIRAAAWTGVGRQTVWGHGRLGFEFPG
jgi:hypothetical protein